MSHASSSSRRRKRWGDATPKRSLVSFKKTVYAGEKPLYFASATSTASDPHRRVSVPASSFRPQFAPVATAPSHSRSTRSSPSSGRLGGRIDPHRLPRRPSRTSLANLTTKTAYPTEAAPRTRPVRVVRKSSGISAASTTSKTSTKKPKRKKKTRSKGTISSERRGGAGVARKKKKAKKSRVRKVPRDGSGAKSKKVKTKRKKRPLPLSHVDTVALHHPRRQLRESESRERDRDPREKILTREGIILAHSPAMGSPGRLSERDLLMLMLSPALRVRAAGDRWLGDRVDSESDSASASTKEQDVQSRTPTPPPPVAIALDRFSVLPTPPESVPKTPLSIPTMTTTAASAPHPSRHRPIVHPSPRSAHLSTRRVRVRGRDAIVPDEDVEMQKVTPLKLKTDVPGLIDSIFEKPSTTKTNPRRKDTVAVDSYMSPMELERVLRRRRKRASEGSSSSGSAVVDILKKSKRTKSKGKNRDLRRRLEMGVEVEVKKAQKVKRKTVTTQEMEEGEEDVEGLGGLLSDLRTFAVLNLSNRLLLDLSAAHARLIIGHTKELHKLAKSRSRSMALLEFAKKSIEMHFGVLKNKTKYEQERRGIAFRVRESYCDGDDDAIFEACSGSFGCSSGYRQQQSYHPKQQQRVYVTATGRVVRRILDLDERRKKAMKKGSDDVVSSSSQTQTTNTNNPSSRVICETYDRLSSVVIKWFIRAMQERLPHERRSSGPSVRFVDLMRKWIGVVRKLLAFEEKKHRVLLSGSGSGGVGERELSVKLEEVDGVRSSLADLERRVLRGS